MTHLGPNERRLLRALHTEGEPTAEDRARVRARVLARVAAGGGIAAAVASAAATTATSAGAATSAAAAGTLAGFSATFKVGAVLVAAATAVGGATWFAASDPGSAPAPARVVAPTVQAPRAATVGVATGAESAPLIAPRGEGVGPARDVPLAGENAPAQTPGTARKPRAVTPTPAGAGSGAARARASDLDSEMSLLESAQQALKDGNAQRALSTLDEHATAHPTGALATERAGIRAVALCEAGKLTEGRREAQRFLAANPRSPLATRVRAACLAPKK